MMRVGSIQRRGEFSRRFWLRSLQTSILALILLGLAIGAGTARPHAARDHVYLLRGALNIFSLGMDQIGERLTRQGVNVTIANHLSWPQLAEQAAAEYKSGRVRNIIIVGHSSGANAVTEMVARLGELRVPVRLAVGLDPSAHLIASGTVGRYVNYWVPGGLGTVVERGPHFRGVLRNISLAGLPGVNHLSIDKTPAVQARVLADIRAAL